MPQRHERSDYAVAGKNGRIVSTGGEGSIVAYAERAVGMIRRNKNDQPESNGERAFANAEGGHHIPASPNPTLMEWTVIKQLEAGHSVYEINHVWRASRANEDVIVTTGDDGVIKIWTP